MEQSSILGFLCKTPGSRDIAHLTALVAAIQQDDEHISPPDIIDAITRAELQTQFPHAIANRLRITDMAATDASAGHRSQEAADDHGKRL